MFAATEFLREQIKNTRKNFLDTVSTVTPEMLSVTPGGKTIPLGATWAHVIFAEDTVIHTMLQQKQTLFETTFKDKTGASMVMPPMDTKWNEAYELWARSVKVDLPVFLEYQKAVFAQTDEYIYHIYDDDLEKYLDLGAFGTKYIWQILDEFVVEHMCVSTGEIAVLKGLQGIRGLPF